MVDREFEYSISILVVDSDEASRRLLADTLGGLGYNILQAAKIEEAEAIIFRQPVDLVMTDTFMPGGDGIDFLLRLKKEKPEIPVVVITDALNKGTQDSLTDAGCDGVLAKPFRINKVEELISTVLLKYDQASLSIPKSRRKILIVDDDLGLIEFMVTAMKALGYEIEYRTKASDAIQAFGQYHFDLVISDYMLPDSSGIELLHNLRKARPDIPFVIITGYPIAYPPSLAKSDGVDGYLIKPFRINQLEQVIADILYPERSKRG